MTTKLLGIATIVAGVILAGAAGVTVMATGGEAGSDGPGFMDNVHQWMQKMHGGGHHGNGMAGLIDQLELTPDQIQRFENVHRIIGSYGASGHASMADLHDRMVTQFEQGYVETGDIRRVVDEHLEQIRLMAYEATDELVALVNGLDERQRGILLQHVQETRSADRGHGHGH